MVSDSPDPGTRSMYLEKGVFLHHFTLRSLLCCSSPKRNSFYTLTRPPPAPQLEIYPLIFKLNRKLYIPLKLKKKLVGQCHLRSAWSGSSHYPWTNLAGLKNLRLDRPNLVTYSGPGTRNRTSVTLPRRMKGNGVSGICRKRVECGAGRNNKHCT